ncbi:hypothetical protein EGY07_12255 [Chryseobacterium indologenes]|jgi:hypothetical protein|uniref:Lipoprotein n=2 Tax=Chryseobacterium indologenes TaxID=253 RepID=A0AAD0YS59_CHRID|nr:MULTISPECIES: hypothetical protein [Chryseobacterium]ATN04853.1 hypothetical protein CRN76_05280 [Chryseobacterium indologenes]AYY86395.1 hypothetical protein EGX91_18475 [Chryseobacterium indologenes]AYZ36297.1 hypothetical protein EGY07_12255 [Chryseobacterium indologenes]AZB16463.1 hypothetical protein EG352_01050 [Chryseobacterium indologenes]MBF6644946.1 hypothetical protein [Chryseobacterium indologenes]
MKKSISLILLPFLFSCQNISNEDIYGKYSPISYKNTCDTLTINRDGVYNRVIYNIKGKKLLNYNSKYKLKGNTIEFNDFYLNFDKDLIAFPEDVRDTDMTYTTFFEKKDKNIVLCFGYHDGENCYKKIIE